MDTVSDMKNKLVSEVRVALEDLVSKGIIKDEIITKLHSAEEYIFKSRGTNDYLMNESLPLYPF